MLTLKPTVPLPLLSFILHLYHSLCYSCNLPQSQITRLQNIPNYSLARVVTRTPKSSHITPVLKSLHWLIINECMKYKLLSHTYKVLTSHNKPTSICPQLDFCSTL